MSATGPTTEELAEAQRIRDAGRAEAELIYSTVQASDMERGRAELAAFLAEQAEFEHDDEEETGPWT